MTAWTDVPVPSTEFAIGASVKSEHGLLFYNNPIAMAEGATGAPRFSTKGIHPGGSETDGALTNSTTIAGVGAVDFTSFTRSSALSLLSSTIIRVNGNLSLSAAITVGTHDARKTRLAQMVGAVSAGDGVGNGGGGSASDGGAGSGTAGLGLQQTFSSGSLLRHWSFARLLIGGLSGAATEGGGGLILIVHGDADFTGGTINANGADGGANGGGGGAFAGLATSTTLTEAQINAMVTR
jgi:hypothetical protein